jgi:hypothetical protein
MTSPENTETVQRRDRSSLWILAVAVVAVVLFWCCVVTNALFMALLVCFVGFVIACGVVVVQLVMRRFRAALLALAAIAIMAGGVAWRGSVLEWARYVDFAVHRSAYERTVEAWRSKNPGTMPFRLVLSMDDRSVLIIDVFDYIVYDESDAIGKDPPVVSGVWLCAIPGWNSEIDMMMGWESHARQLSGHFYFVEQTG